MSGGVDSATAAARAVDAGHDVTGIHLALSANPKSYRTGARGCCTLEDARDARRAADVIGIPFYVWDMAERFHHDVVEDFVAEYAAGRTPNPCLRCNEKIKFAAVLDRALALGFDAVCTGHYARIENRVLHRAADPGKDQSYVLAVLTSEQLSHAIFPLGGTPKAQVRAEAAARGLAVAGQAGQPRRLLHRRRRHQGLPGPPPGPGPRPDRRPDRCRPRQPRRHLRLHRRPAPRPARRHPRRRRPSPLRPGHRARHPYRHRRPRREPGRHRDHRHPPRLDRLPPACRAPRLPGPAPRPRRRPPLHRPPGSRRTAHPPTSPRPRRSQRPGRRSLPRRHRPRQRHHQRHVRGDLLSSEFQDQDQRALDQAAISRARFSG